jgi:hypothetical protein
VFVLILGQTSIVDKVRPGVVPLIPEGDAALAELRKQGLTVRLHSRENNTWYIADGGIYSGYIATGDELVELSRANNLNIREIKSLG